MRLSISSAHAVSISFCSLLLRLSRSRSANRARSSAGNESASFRICSLLMPELYQTASLPSLPPSHDNAVVMSQAPQADPNKSGIPEGLWLRCPNPDCGEMLFRKAVEEAMHVCPKCEYHFRISARTRIEQLLDPGSFEEMYIDIEPADPLRFVDKKAYKDRLASDQKKTGNADAVVCGKGF